MKKLLAVTVLCMALFFGVSSVASASGNYWGNYCNDRCHVVQYGETLFSIGRMYDANPYHIAEANGLYDPNHIYAGQVLYIPQGSRYPWWSHANCGNNCGWQGGWDNNCGNNCGWRGGWDNNCGNNCGWQGGWDNNCGNNCGWERPQPYHESKYDCGGGCGNYGGGYYGYDYTGYYYGNYHKDYSHTCGYYSNCW